MRVTIDLDAAADLLAERLRSRPDLTVGPLTWRGFETRFDEPNEVSRGAIVDPFSMGVLIARGTEEGRLVLFAGGWADFEYWAGTIHDQPALEAPGADGESLTLERYGQLVDRLLDSFKRDATT